MAHINGSLLKNYAHCKRQAYLYYLGINFRNELIKKGEALHEINKSQDMVFDNIKVDIIKEGNLIELKKTSSNFKGTKLQILYYLKYFKDRGVILQGIIKDMTTKKTYEVSLTNKNEAFLLNTIKEINNLIKQKEIPERLPKRSMCKGCSFYNYCWIE